jgi:hypothetical protein
MHLHLSCFPSNTGSTPLTLPSYGAYHRLLDISPSGIVVNQSTEDVPLWTVGFTGKACKDEVSNDLLMITQDWTVGLPFAASCALIGKS